jgi:hypothetical protein
VATLLVSRILALFSVIWWVVGWLLAHLVIVLQGPRSKQVPKRTNTSCVRDRPGDCANISVANMAGGLLRPDN